MTPLPELTPAEQAYEDATEKWVLIATSAEDNSFLRTVVQLGAEMHANVSVTLRIPGDERMLSVSFTHFEDDDEDGPPEGQGEP